jgi:hypothetical protein
MPSGGDPGDEAIQAPVLDRDGRWGALAVTSESELAWPP